jgi:hypothetical protein
MRNADEKRKRLAEAVEEYQAILFLLGSLTKDALQDGEQVVQIAGTATRRQLDEMLAHCRQKLVELRESYAVRIASKEVVAIYRDVCSGSLDRHDHYPSWAYFSKHRLAAWIGQYGRIHPPFDRLPLHARIALSRPPQPPRTEVFLPEAILFEEMAMLFNEAVRAEVELGTQIDPYKLKRFRSFLHACHTTTFHFIEAYLNGIASDYAMRNAGKVSNRDLSVLTEWDFEKQREKRGSFRDRLIQIPRILLGLQHPPLTESNEPNIRTLLQEGKSFRDAIVHSSPSPSPKDLIKAQTPDGRKADAEAAVFQRMNKEDYLVISEVAPLARIVDAAIIVVGRIDRLIDGYMSQLGYLHQRNAEGVFPKETFN